MTDGIIFDVDGTLWDSTDAVAIAYNKALERYTDLPVRVDASMLKQLFGKPMDEIFYQLVPELSEKDRLFVTHKCIELEEEELELADPTPMLYPGIEELFRSLSPKCPLYIVSNCQCGYIEQFLRKNGFERYIQDHLCFGQTGTTKGQTILRLMHRNHLTHPVYVGDTSGDASASQEAGIPFIHAAYGFGTAEQPDYVIHAPLELLDLPLSFAKK